jgi:hypothetical protein
MNNPEHISRVLDRVLERVARAACADHTGFAPDSEYVDKHWQVFFPAARASYREIIKIDEEATATQGCETSNMKEKESCKPTPY